MEDDYTTNPRYMSSLMHFSLLHFSLDLGVEELKRAGHKHTDQIPASELVRRLLPCGAHYSLRLVLTYR